MKTNAKILGLALLSASIFSAAAQDGPPSPPPGAPLPPALKKFDKDGDGKLSPDELAAMKAEREAAREKRQKEMLEKYDKDKDGKLSDEEKDAMKADLKAKHEAILAKYDKDKDGKLSKEEREAAIAAGEELPFMPMEGGRKGGPRGDKGGKPPGDAPAPAPEKE